MRGNIGILVLDLEGRERERANEREYRDYCTRLRMQRERPNEREY